MTYTQLNKIPNKDKPKENDKFDLSDDTVLEGGPCTGLVAYIDDRWIVLMRGDEEECKAFGLIALDGVCHNGVWDFRHNGNSNI